MKTRQGILALIMAGGVVLAALVPDANAESGGLTPGTYRCSSYNVSGGGGSCRNLAPLVLHPDGSYQYSSTRGRWSVRNDTLFLSQSKLWGPGKILGRGTIRMEYDYQGWHHVVTWSCQECASAVPRDAGSAAAPGAVPSGSYVGVSLVLEFGVAVGGVSGFTLVPAESSRSYTHNAPLPEGSVQGLARETSRTAVTLVTNRSNKLLSGRRYVVFLDWPRETIPVAVLDLPPLSADYTATLPATLDGASVLAQVSK